MAAPTFVQAGTGAIWQSGGAVTVSLAGVTVGNCVFLHVLEDGTGATPLVPGSVTGSENTIGLAGITSLGGSDVGSPKAAENWLWIGFATATTVSADLSQAEGDDLYMRWYEFSGVARDGATLGASIENGGSTFLNGVGTSTTIADTGVTTNGADRLACQFVAVNDDNAVGDFTGETGGDWVEAVAEFLSATGTDGCIQLQTATIASAGTINGGSFVMAASDPWGVIGLALIPEAPKSLAARRSPEKGLVMRMGRHASGLFVPARWWEKIHCPQPVPVS